MANLSPGTGSAKPFATATAGTPFLMTSPSPLSSAMALMSFQALFIDGMPPWCSETSFRPFDVSLMSLKKPICDSLPAEHHGGGGRVGVVLDRDRLALGDVLEHRRQHRLLDGRLEGLAVGGLDRDVELGHLTA